MGTIRKAVNIAKSIFQSRQEKAIYKGRKERRNIESREAKRKTALRDPQLSGFQYKHRHTHGGGRQWNGQAVFAPRHRRRKGYEKDAQINNTFNKRKIA